ncbi:MAG: CotH kinase family protein, partial [Verrucomicrobiota bacterium]
TADQTRSHAEFNATFLSQDGTGPAVRYLAGVRNRGNGSRSRQPQSLRVNFRNDDRWKDTSALNLNSQYTPLQLLGSALYRRAGLGAAASVPALVRLHQSNLSTPGRPAYGFHAVNEVLNSDYAARAFPEDSSGNLYRGIRLVRNGASLGWEGADPAPYRDNYFKQTNTSQDDWSDLVALCRILNLTPDAEYADALRAAVDVDQWLTYFAVETLVVNRETNLANGNNGGGQGDDYFLYFGRQDPRARLLPYDLDTILGQGDSTADPREGLFRMNAVPAIGRFMRHPDIAPLYYRKLLALLDDAFAAPTFDRLVDQVLGDRVDAAYRGELKDFMARRRVGVLEQIPTRLTATNNTLTRLNGAYQAGPGTLALHGQAPAAGTRSVQVGGQPAAWSAWEARWTNAAVALLPGRNRILVQAFDEAGREIDRTSVDVDVSGSAAIGVPGGALAADTTWTAAQGPFHVAGTVTVGAGRTLTIEAGTTVFLAPGAALVATGGGRLLAGGTDQRHVRLAGSATATGAWGGVLIQDGGTQVSRLDWVDFDRAGSAGYNLRVENSTLHLAHATFAGTTAQYVDLRNSSFVIEQCVFPDLAGLELIHASGLPPTGHGIFRGNWFGRSSGYNDIIDFTGGNRPDAIVQFLDNVFHGAPDDCFDMDGTDAHIEGNLFFRVRQDAARASSSNPITTGADGGNTSELVIVRNIFADSDHALLLKDGGSAVFHHNTVVRLLDNPLASEPPGLITFFERRSGVTPGGTA